MALRLKVLRNNNLSVKSPLIVLLFMALVIGITTTSSEVTVTVSNTTEPEPIVSSLWQGTETPVTASAVDTDALELGVKFQPTVLATVKGMKFYKDIANTGTHVGNLWRADGTLLASVTFDNESPSGWQVATFNEPVAVQPDTTYIVSYHAPNGRYAVDRNYFAASRTNTTGTLTAPAHNVRDGNGVYKYGATSAFPNESYQASNYWVDVVIESQLPVPDTEAPSAPTGLSATATSNTRIKLSWAASTDNKKVTGYKVFRGGTQIATSTGKTYTYTPTDTYTDTDTDLTANTTYDYYVVATDAAGNVSGQSNGVSVTTQNNAPGTCPSTKRTITTLDVTNIKNSGYPAGTQTYVPGSQDPWGGCFPNADNTGVPASTTLTDYTGHCDVRTDNTVVDAKIIRDGCGGRFLINANNVTITNSKFVGISTIDVQSGSLTIRDSEADFGSDPWGQGLAGSNITAQRLHFYGGHRQVICLSSCVVEDSYFHGQDVSQDPLAHASAVRTGEYTTYRHNTIYCELEYEPGGGGCSAAQTGYPDFGPIHHNTVEKNLVIADATGFCAYGGWNLSKPYNDHPDNATYITFRDNVITRGTNANNYQDWQFPVTSRHRYTCGYWGPVTSFASERPGFVFTGNMWDDGLLLEDDTDNPWLPWY